MQAILDAFVSCSIPAQVKSAFAPVEPEAATSSWTKDNFSLKSQKTDAGENSNREDHVPDSLDVGRQLS